ncbi:hypothetical protein JTE90_016455 [Oedothorax gibbosus]|uniref:Tyrosine specific protein phosphatases domain-containing protein n=1 Tax=Oedothorax gibbosus TaxID=931172 RepID=A0AAV6V4K6_9ARAC|nr:hypothetical protein JTE90_016455 [Oedothorax gibbosus]
MGKKKQIPDRWMDYAPMKEAFLDARIIPIKVPLPDHRFCNDYMYQYKWTPTDVMTGIPNVGLIIDATYKTPPYYDPREFTSQGIEYAKVMCAGHFVPSEEVYQQFSEIVKRFLLDPRNNGKIIAMHCTHGVNRTGYLLCRYLIENLNYPPAQALDTFAMTRGHPVERDNYKEALFNLPIVRRF